MPEEILVVDDQSTDNTRETVENIHHEKIQVRCISLGRKGGAQAARNEGIRQASRPWIAFNDSDDEWMPDKIAKQFGQLEASGFDAYTVVHGNCIAKDHQKNIETLWEFPVVEGLKPYHSLLKGPSPVFPNILTSKRALEDIGLLDETVPSYQEWDTALLLSKICTFIHIKEPLFTYHLHTGDTISKNKKGDVAGRHYILMKYRKDIIEHYGNQFFIDSLLDNVKRIVIFKEWGFGSKLIKEIQSYIPLKTFLYYSACFRFRLNPDSIKEKRSLGIL